MPQVNPDLLRTERMQLGWTQAKVAEVLGISIKTVRRWEQGRSVPYPYHRRQLSVLFGKTVQQLGLLEGTEQKVVVHTEELEQSSLERLPPALQPTSFLADLIIWEALSSANRLLGRSDLLTHIKERLCAADPQTFLALHGLPGSGKTALAAALATDRQVQAYFSDGILWAGLGQRPKVLNQLAHWGKLLGIVPNQMENCKSRQAWSQVLRTAIGSRRFLLVIDNVWKIEDAWAFRIGGPQCTYLLTTCQSEVAFAFDREEVITIPRLEEAEGLALLTHFVPHLVDQDPQGALSLVQGLDNLPLALILMGNTLASPTFIECPWSLRAALAQLLNTQERLRLSMLATSRQHWPKLTETVPLSLYAMIALSDQQLSPKAQAALRALSIFPPKPESFSMETALAVTRQPREMLDELWEAGLLESWGSGRYTLHQAVADYASAGIQSWWSNNY